MDVCSERTGAERRPEYAAYRALTDRADEADVGRIIEGVGKEKDDAVREHYRVLLRLVVEKNPQFIEKIRREIEMEDVIDIIDSLKQETRSKS